MINFVKQVYASKKILRGKGTGSRKIMKNAYSVNPIFVNSRVVGGEMSTLVFEDFLWLL